MSQDRSFRGLVVWQQAMALTKDCYLLTRDLPKEEMYGLTTQIRRAAISIPANIAEGSGRGTRRDYVNFLRIAQGSLRELQTYLLLIPDLKFTTIEKVIPLRDQGESIARLLNRLIQALKRPTP